MWASALLDRPDRRADGDHEQVCKLIVNLRNLVNVEVKEPEKALDLCKLRSTSHTEKSCQDLPVIFAEAEKAQRNHAQVGSDQVNLVPTGTWTCCLEGKKCQKHMLWSEAPYGDAGEATNW